MFRDSRSNISTCSPSPTLVKPGLGFQGLWRRTCRDIRGDIGIVEKKMEATKNGLGFTGFTEGFSV